jgi:probable rRNA maturation factor
VKKDKKRTSRKKRAGSVLITSNQKLVKLDRAGLRRDVRKILALLGTGQQELSLMIVDDEGIRTINRDYLRKDRPTNVIAFSLAEGDFGDVNPGVLGDVVVSVETAAREARAARIPVEDAILYLIIHGILHLAGYDHEGPNGIARARIMSAVQQAVFLEIRGYRLDFTL